MIVPPGKLAIFSLFKLVFLLLKIKPQAVHCHMRRANILGLTAAKIARIPKRIFTRHYSTQNHQYFPASVKTDLFLNRLATTIVAPSETVMATLMDKENVPQEKISLIYHGFDLEYFARPNPEGALRIRQSLKLIGQGPVVGVISRFLELKGLQLIIPAFAGFLKDYPDAVLLLANAHGPYETEVNKLLKSLPPESWHKIKFEAELSSLYQSMDMFVHTPIDEEIEAFGQVYVEALASGIPSVFSLSGIAHQLIKDNDNALVVPYNDSGSITTALCKLQRDESLRNRLSESGKQSVQTFAFKHFMRKTEKLYV